MIDFKVDRGAVQLPACHSREHDLGGLTDELKSLSQVSFYVF